MQIIKLIIKYGLTTFALLFFSVTFAGEHGIGGVADNVLSNLPALARLITAAAYIAGLGFGMSALLKFKAHKDNPQSVPIGTPIALLILAGALIFMPALFTMTGQTLFGDDAVPGGVSGRMTVPQ